MVEEINFKNLIKNGKRHFALDEFSEAVENFAKACSLKAKIHGDMAYECAECYLLYGKSLLELGRKENNIFCGDDKEINKTEELNCEMKNDNNNNETESEETNEKLENEVPVSNLQLAWEVLDLARLIFIKKDQDVSNINLAETYLKLGELGMELEDHEKAISDLINCLEIQQKYLQPHDRRIAETHYNLSLAYSLVNNFYSAVTSIKNAMEIIDKRLKFLVTTKFEDQNEKNQDEIPELEMVMKDLKEKLIDYEECIKNPVGAALVNDDTIKPTISNATTEIQQTTTLSQINGIKNDEHQQIDDITHLVKRKKTNE